MYVASTAIPNSAGDIRLCVFALTGEYFTIDTDEYYPICYKVNDAKTFKNLAYYFTLCALTNHYMYIADWLV